LPFQTQREISPGKNALLHCTTAGFTTPPLDHESFATLCPLALLGFAFYPVLVHRLAASIHASFPHSVTLVQLRFSSLAVINLRRDLHPLERAHAGRTKKGAGLGAGAASICLELHDSGMNQALEGCFSIHMMAMDARHMTPEMMKDVE
jgi:hypothetical protein